MYLICADGVERLWYDTFYRSRKQTRMVGCPFWWLNFSSLRDLTRPWPFSIYLFIIEGFSHMIRCRWQRELRLCYDLLGKYFPQIEDTIFCKILLTRNSKRRWSVAEVNFRVLFVRKLFAMTEWKIDIFAKGKSARDKLILPLLRTYILRQSTRRVSLSYRSFSDRVCSHS